MRRNVLILMATSLFAAFGAAATNTWCPHVTALAGWKTEIELYSSGGAPVSYQIEKFDAGGNSLGVLSGLAAGKAWTVVAHASLAYEGTAWITSSADLLVKAVYQAGESPSVCEFYLTGAAGTGWVLPNPLRSWLEYVGLALVNPSSTPVTLTLEAWKDGVKAAPDTTVPLPGKSKYVMLSNGIWGGVNYADLDTLVVHSSAPIPAPISITGNLAGDRHLFFAAQPEPASGALVAGDLVETDPIVGNLRYVPAGTFTQGSPGDEPCRDSDETPFTHTQTQGLAVMETEVTRQMWADLKATQPTLPTDPTNTNYGGGMSNPVQQATWHEALLFANLLSAQRGLTRCYYTDAGCTAPVTAVNYTAGPYYCNWSANGYRLPTEGEWERFCRAGTTTPFWIAEPHYAAGNCSSTSTPGMYPQLETAAWFWGNSASHSASSPVGTKAANPWNLKDAHGNVWEWCWDRYGTYPSGSQTDYRGAGTGSNRVYRGGGWDAVAQNVRAPRRHCFAPGGRDGILGLRLARVAR